MQIHTSQVTEVTHVQPQPSGRIYNKIGRKRMAQSIGHLMARLFVEQPRPHRVCKKILHIGGEKKLIRSMGSVQCICLELLDQIPHTTFHSYLYIHEVLG